MGPLLLYALLLLSFVPLFTAESDGSLHLEHSVQIFDSILVLVFCLIYFRSIWPSLTKVQLSWCFYAAALGVMTFGIATLFVTAANSYLGFEEFSYSQPYFDAGYGWTVVCLSVIAQPAIVEELAFRGVILDSMRRLMSTREAIIVTAAMFMILHLNPLAFPHLMVMGVVLGWLRIKTGSIWPCIVLHAVHNGLVIFEEYLFMS